VPPSGGGGAGLGFSPHPSDSELLALKQLGKDSTHHAVHVQVDVLRAHSHHPIPTGLEPCVAPLVVSPRDVIVVCGTDDFHDDACGRAAEVDEVGSDRVLPPKLPTVELTPA